MNKKIIWLTGASGVGKTTLVENLSKKYSERPTWEFLKFDSIGVPSSEDMVRDFGSVENWQKAKTWEWIGKMVSGYLGKDFIIMEGQSNMEFIIEGFKNQTFLNYQIILVDCEQETMVKRLVDERQQAWLASDDMRNWLKFLRTQAQKLKVQIINTSKLDKNETIEEFEKVARI